MSGRSPQWVLGEPVIVSPLQSPANPPAVNTLGRTTRLQVPTAVPQKEHPHNRCSALRYTGTVNDLRVQHEHRQHHALPLRLLFNSSTLTILSVPQFFHHLESDDFPLRKILVVPFTFTTHIKRLPAPPSPGSNHSQPTSSRHGCLEAPPRPDDLVTPDIPCPSYAKILGLDDPAATGVFEKARRPFSPPPFQNEQVSCLTRLTKDQSRCSSCCHCAHPRTAASCERRTPACDVRRLKGRSSFAFVLIGKPTVLLGPSRVLRCPPPAFSIHTLQRRLFVT